MNRNGPARSRAAALAVIAACLGVLASSPAAGAATPKPITGSLDRKGLTVVALAPHGRITEARARPGFRLVPPATVVTLHLRNRKGDYLGPIVLRGRGGKVTVGVRAGARLGRIAVLDGYARARHAPGKRAYDKALYARARHGVPVGVGSLGWVKGRPHGPRGPGRDRDRDGIPDKFDVDDDGNLVLDVRQQRTAPASAEARLVATKLPLSACPGTVCSGNIRVSASDTDRANLALIVAIVAAVLAAISLIWQVVSSRRWRRQRVTVDVRLGLPIYQQGGGDWCIFVEVVNGTEHPVRWVSASLELPDGRRLYLMQQPPGGELPAILQPHESHQTWTRARELEVAGLDLTEPLVGAAKLDSGEIVRSRRGRLLSRSAAKRLRS
jgi:hypothetical protein